MSGLVKSLVGSGESETNVTQTTHPPSAEELELIRLNTQLAQKQLANLDQLAPYQQELIKLSMEDLKRQSAMSGAMDAAISPEDQAGLAKSEFERAKKLGPVQDQILEMQLANMHGELTPGQQAAVEAAIEAGYGDIDRATSEGIGIISDEIANARGLRLTDTPILREATMLSKAGLEQKASLAKNLRAQSLFQMPGASSGIGLAQQQLAEQTKAFQADLRQRAFQNRLALSGQTMSGGIGLATIGSNAGTSQAATLAGTRGHSGQSIGFNPAAYMTGWGQFMQGAGSLIGAGSKAMAGTE